MNIPNWRFLLLSSSELLVGFVIKWTSLGMITLKSALEQRTREINYVLCHKLFNEGFRVGRNDYFLITRSHRQIFLIISRIIYDQSCFHATHALSLMNFASFLPFLGLKSHFFSMRDDPRRRHKVRSRKTQCKQKTGERKQEF